MDPFTLNQINLNHKTYYCVPKSRLFKLISKVKPHPQRVPAQNLDGYFYKSYSELYSQQMSKLNYNSLIRLGKRPDSKLSEARSKISLISDNNHSVKISEIASSVSSALRLDLKLCGICLERKSNSEFGTFCKCQHLFCKQCLGSYLSSKIFINQINIKCLDEDCNQIMDERSIFFQNLPQNLKEKYFKIKQNKTVMSNPLLSHCPTAGCKKILQRINKSQPFHCSECKLNFCPVCLLQEHVGECDSFAEMYLKNNYQYKKCPNCRMIVQKIDGCDHMTCSCGHQFCYRCGGRYSGGHNCQFYEYFDLDEPVTTPQRVLNHILLPFVFVLGFGIIVVLFVVSEALVAIMFPFAALGQIFKSCDCSCFLKLVFMALCYPFVLIVSVIYGQVFVMGWILSWFDLLGRAVLYLRR